MSQLILHLIGDYILQSDWMAQNKTRSSFACLCHCLAYSLPFCFIGSSVAVFVIFATHFLIDRWRLARFVCYAKNIVLGLWIKRTFVRVPDCDADPEAWNAVLKEHLSDTEAWHWPNCSVTGYPSQAPQWLTVWLLIVCDNTLHLACNALALHFL